MIPAQFDYHAPTTVDEALRLLAEVEASGRDVKVLGGGQSLLPVLRLRMAAPEVVVDLNKIPDLRGVRDDGDAVVIGAMTTHDNMTREPLVRQHALLLSVASATVADPQVRHRGTFGGAIVHADPAGDIAAPVLALDCDLVIQGPGGRRTVAAADFFEDLFTTAVGEGELLVEIRVPKYTGWGARYEKFTRVAQAWSVVAVAAAVKVEGGSIAQARVGLTNMGSVPIRAHAVEAALIGQPATADAIKEATRRAGEGTTPPTDANADAEFRRHLAGVLTGRAVLAAAGAS
ncbi:MAG: xanthine dehydrogenase family protein subunit M [Rhodoferax sp.]|nr:xanthine dehydrogenase family protein subunit M [Actinomycetota bacterium]